MIDKSLLYGIDKDKLDMLKYSLDPIAFIRDIIWKPMKYQMKPFHKEWIRFMEDNRFTILLASRGHSKSISMASYIIYKIVTNPNIRILLITVSRDKAFEIMNFIKHQLEHNDKLISIFGEQRGMQEWSRSELRVKNQGILGMSYREPTLTVVGVDSELIGGHYDAIFMDDVVSPKNSRTEYQRMKLRNWFYNVVMPMLEPDGDIHISGTKWFKTDLYYTLSNTSRFKVKIYKAIIKEKTENQKPIVLWPERFPYDELCKKRDEGRINFYMQYQNEIISPEDAIIQQEWIQYYDNIPQNLRRYIGVDLSASTGEKGDYFAIVVIGIDDNNNIYVLDGIRKRATLTQQIDLIYYMSDKWDPIKIGVEANAMQKLIKDYIQQTTLLPIIPIKTSTDKISRVSKISVYFETGRIFFNPKMVYLVDELLEFPRGQYDDSTDALSFSIEVAQQSKPRNWENVVKLVDTKQNIKIVKV